MQGLDAQGLEFWHLLMGTSRPQTGLAFQDLFAELDPDMWFELLSQFIRQFEVELPA